MNERRHVPALIAALGRLYAVNVVYPPRPDTTSDPESLRAWLLEEPVAKRWVGIYDGAPVGHVQVSPVHDYLIPHLPAGPERYFELGKFFVDPAATRTGSGAALFTIAYEFARSHGLGLAAAVLDGSRAARTFYERRGMVEVASFTGRHGVNRVHVLDV